MQIQQKNKKDPEEKAKGDISKEPLSDTLPKRTIALALALNIVAACTASFEGIPEIDGGPDASYADGGTPDSSQDSGPMQDGAPMNDGGLDSGIMDSGMDGGEAGIMDAGPDANSPCTGAKAQTVNGGNFPIDTDTPVGGYNLKFKSQVSGGITMDISCESNGVLLFPTQTFLHSALKSLARLEDSLNIDVTSNFDSPSSANVTVSVHP